MATRLYLQDPYLASFRARVLEVREVDGKPAAVLDQTAFYPASWYFRTPGCSTGGASAPRQKRKLPAPSVVSSGNGRQRPAAGSNAA